MRKKCYHFFGGLLNAQANWLNKMSEKEGLSDYYDVCIYLPKVQSNANGKSA